jgi:CHASE1-domain containing sensor protein
MIAQMRKQLEKQTKAELIDLIETLATLNTNLMRERIEEKEHTVKVSRAFWFMTALSFISTGCVYYLTHR